MLKLMNDMYIYIHVRTSPYMYSDIHVSPWKPIVWLNPQKRKCESVHKQATSLPTEFIKGN